VVQPKFKLEACSGCSRDGVAKTPIRLNPATLRRLYPSATHNDVVSLMTSMILDGADFDDALPVQAIISQPKQPTGPQHQSAPRAAPFLQGGVLFGLALCPVQHSPASTKHACTAPSRHAPSWPLCCVFCPVCVAKCVSVCAANPY